MSPGYHLVHALLLDDVRLVTAWLAAHCLGACIAMPDYEERHRLLLTASCTVSSCRRLHTSDSCISLGAAADRMLVWLCHRMLPCPGIDGYH